MAACPSRGCTVLHLLNGERVLVVLVPRLKLDKKGCAARFGMGESEDIALLIGDTFRS